MSKMNSFPTSDETHIVIRCKLKLINEPKFSSTILKSIAGLANAKGGFIFFRKNTKDDLKSIYDDSEYEKDLEPIVSEVLESLPSGFESINVKIQKMDDKSPYPYIEVPEYKDSLIVIEENSKRKLYFKTLNRLRSYNDENLSKYPKGKVLKYLFLKSISDLEKSSRKPYFHFNVNHEMQRKVLYKYMSLDSFVLSMIYGFLFLVEPSKWSDKYEGRFYKANYKNHSYKGQQIFATCFTSVQANEAAWKVYARGTGMGARCIQVQLDITKFDDIFKKCNVLDSRGNIIPNNKFRLGDVSYYLTDMEIDNLHKRNKTYHDTFFKNFCLNSFLNLLCLKRKAYEYEHEVRLFLIPSNHTSIKYKKNEDCRIEFPWKDVIQKMWVDKRCSESELYAIQKACEKAKVKCSKPLDDESKCPQGKIPLILFDIDEMKGPKRLTIGK